MKAKKSLSLLSDPDLIARFRDLVISAERKIRAARLMRRFPGIKEKLESGKLNLSLLEIAQGVVSSEKLGEEEFSEILESVCGLSCRKARRELADRYPQSQDAYSDRIRPISAELSEVRVLTGRSST